ncbi:acylphosphatase [Candidatus Micrarchaeota archaeon]|nr:acylphosphatase [Candidatus Micrarchaeota archaeon]
MPEAIHIMISGDVQGVFFRAGVQDQARKLNLTGWARNTPDGAVEVLAEGERLALENLLEWCYHGPAGASVSAIEYGWVEPAGLKDFRIRYG